MQDVTRRSALVTGAASGIGAGRPLATRSLAEGRRVMDVNLDGAFPTLATALRAIEGKRGPVVAVSSPAGLKPVSGIGPYGASTPAAARISREATLETMANTTPPGRFATSGEMAGSIRYLLSDAASNMTGPVLVSDGGFIL